MSMAKNDSKVKRMGLDHLTANMSNLVRYEVWDGKDYLVAPVVLIKEGVWNGLLYRESDLKKYPESWNGRPIPVMHPMKKDGRTPETANTPENLEKKSIGYLFNTQYDSGSKKLKSEMWILEDKANTIDPQIMNTLHNEQMLEVSTGLFTEILDEQGEFDGRPYRGVAINFRPDHLAVLPGKEGACSVADGAGAPRINQKKEENTLFDRIVSKVKEALHQDSPEVNEASYSEKELMVIRALQSEYANQHVFPEGVYEDRVVFTVEDENFENPKMYKRNYELNEDSEVVTFETSVPVKREISYVELEKQPEMKTHNSGVPDMEKKVEALIANEQLSFSEDDREWLMSLDEEKLDKLAPVVNDGDDGDDGDDESQDPKQPNSAAGSKQEEGSGDGQQPTINQEKKDETPLTLEAIRKVVREEVDTKLQTNAKQPILQRLIKNERCPLSEESLRTLSESELKKLEASVTPGNFAGRGTVVANAGSSVPEMPVWNFDN